MRLPFQKITAQALPFQERLERFCIEVI
jgi:hypothetical protein